MSRSSRISDLDKIDDFADFCGEYAFDFSTVDLEKAEILNQFLQRGAHYQALFSLFDKDEDQLVLSTLYLFSINKITREQMATLLEIREMREAFGANFRQMFVFDEEGGLETTTLFALGGLLPLNSEDAFEVLRKKPKSEHCYFYMEVPADDLKNERLKGLLDLAHAQKIIKKNSAPPVSFERFTFEEAKKDSEDKSAKKVYLIVPSTGMSSAFFKSRYGANAKSLLPRLGKFNKEDIERSMKRKGRYIAVACPTVENESSFHRIQARTFYLGLHDKIHAALTSSIPNLVYEAFLSAIDIMRQKTGITWSKELWDSTDMEIGEFLDDLQSDRVKTGIADVTQGFIRILQAPVYTENRDMLLFSPSPLNDTTWLLMIDLILNAKSWREMGIEPDLFRSDSTFSNLYRFAEDNIEFVTDETSAARQVAIIKSKFLGPRPIVSTDVEFVKEKNYLQVVVDGKPIIASKPLVIELKKMELKPERLAQIPNIDLAIIPALEPAVIELLKNNNIINLLIWKKLTIDDLVASSPDVRERLKKTSNYDALKEERTTFQEIKEKALKEQQEKDAKVGKLERAGGGFDLLSLMGKKDKTDKKPEVDATPTEGDNSKLKK